MANENETVMAVCAEWRDCIESAGHGERQFAMTTYDQMREALKAINCINTGGLKRLLVELVESDIFDGGLINKTISAVEKARRALSKPPRNCDVGTAEEQSNRMRKFCAKQKRNGIINCGYCPIKHQYQRDCTLAWAQMPYEAEEGGEENGKA